MRTEQVRGSEGGICDVLARTTRDRGRTATRQRRAYAAHQRTQRGGARDRTTVPREGAP